MIKNHEFKKLEVPTLNIQPKPKAYSTDNNNNRTHLVPNLCGYGLRIGDKPNIWQHVHKTAALIIPLKQWSPRSPRIKEAKGCFVGETCSRIKAKMHQRGQAEKPKVSHTSFIILVELKSPTIKTLTS